MLVIVVVSTQINVARLLSNDQELYLSSQEAQKRFQLQKYQPGYPSESEKQFKKNCFHIYFISIKGSFFHYVNMSSLICAGPFFLQNRGTAASFKIIKSFKKKKQKKSKNYLILLAIRRLEHLFQTLFCIIHQFDQLNP